MCSESIAFIDRLKKSPLGGMFIFPSGIEVPGMLNLTESKNQLTVWWNNEESCLLDELTPTIKSVRGFLSKGNRLKVSLFNCTWGRSFLPFRGEEESKHFYKTDLSFDYAVFGHEYISHDKDLIDKVTFVMDDAKSFFNDPAVFGATVPEGPLFTADTIMGKVSALASRETNGLFIENEVSTILRLDEAVTFEDAVFRTFRVLHFFELLVGRPQNLVNLLVRKLDLKSHSNKWPLHVYGRRFPKHERSEEERRPGALMNAVQNPEKFSETLKKWLERDKDWREARDRFFSSCFTKHHYDEDRLVAAANMFDLLPYKKDSVLKRKIDRRPKGDSALKWKIRLLAEKVVAEFGEDKVPKLVEITDKAEECRNHYVHGTPTEIDCEKEREFLTATLEFIFVASDLIKAGWDMKAWYETCCQSFTIPKKSDIEAMRIYHAVTQATGHQLFQYMEDSYMHRKE